METIKQRPIDPMSVANPRELTAEDTDRLFRLELAAETAEAWRIERDGLQGWKQANKARTKRAAEVDREVRNHFLAHWSARGWRDEESADPLQRTLNVLLFVVGSISIGAVLLSIF